jgi:hypothetical protein
VCLLRGTRCILSVIQGNSFQIIFVVDEVTFGQVSFPALLFSPVSIISPMLHTLLHLQTVEVWEPSKKQCYCRNQRALGKCLHVLMSERLNKMSEGGSTVAGYAVIHN